MSSPHPARGLGTGLRLNLGHSTIPAAPASSRVNPVGTRIVPCLSTSTMEQRNLQHLLWAIPWNCELPVPLCPLLLGQTKHLCCESLQGAEISTEILFAAFGKRSFGGQVVKNFLPALIWCKFLVLLHYFDIDVAPLLRELNVKMYLLGNTGF